MRQVGLPDAIRSEMKRALRLEYWTLAWIGSIVIVMYLAMGTSQAMKSAWLEDLLSLVPAIVFIIAAHFERRAPDDKFRYGYSRVNSLAFLIAAVALVSVGGFLLFESAKSLLMQEHPSIGLISLLGHEIWLGWVMIAALTYSVIPPVILGRIKLPVARTLQDKVLHTDALMQKADWMTGLAGVAGILGVGLGYWWADAAASAFISFAILRDGVYNLRISTAELIDGMPRELDSEDIAADARKLEAALNAKYPDAEIRMRESGRFILVQITGVANSENIMAGIEPLERPWRLEIASVEIPSSVSER